jgi:hypothetical protein
MGHKTTSDGGHQPTPPDNSEDDLLAPALVVRFGLRPPINKYSSSSKGLIVAAAGGGDAVAVQCRPPSLPPSLGKELPLHHPTYTLPPRGTMLILRPIPPVGGGSGGNSGS